MNNFISSVMASKGSAYTENGAISYASTGKELIDQFGKAASYRGREISVVFDDQARLWAENPEAALKFPFYLRLITREAKMSDGTKTEKVQRGAGVKDEAFKRFVWILKNHPDMFYRNLYLVPIVGSWKDIWQILYYAEDANVKVDKSKFFEVVAEGIASDSQVDLVKKYLPRIRSTKKCKTTWALCTNKYAKEFVEWADKQLDGKFTAESYRHLKASGEAHDFQKVICSRRYDELNFKTIPGKALLNLVSGDFLKNHAIYDKYVEWIKSQPVAKFNGYPYELGHKLGYNGRWGTQTKVDIATKITIDKQFENLVLTGKKNGGAITGNVWCALDTSGSMNSTIPGSDVTALDVCKSLGIYFSTMNEGAFHKNVIMFDNTSRVKQLSGSFSEMWDQIPYDAMGSTNFQSVVDEIVRIRKSHPSIPLSDYPKTLLVVSDMQFNPSNTWLWGRTVTRQEELSNIEAAKAKLRQAFPKEFVDEFKFIWWNVTSRRTEDMPSTLDDQSSYFFSGFDGAVISFLLGGDAEIVDDKTGQKRMPTAEELVQIAFSQEVISLVR